MALDTNRPKNYKRAWKGGRDLVKQPLTAEEWNAQYPVGTPVIVVKDHGEMWETKTRSEAWNLGHGQPVVMLEGKSGGYDLSRVTPTGA
jgi:hypothetical protein